MSVGKNRDKSHIPNEPDDWLWSDKELDLAEEYMEEEITIDAEHDVPYTAGYSEDGNTIYMDKYVPQHISVRSISSRMEKVEVDLFKTFAFHETIEKSLEAEPYFLPYQLAHQIALRAERMYVQSLGADWNDYNEQTLRIVNEIGDRASYPNCPDDLDIEPYCDEDDDETLKKMKCDSGRDFWRESEEEEIEDGEEDGDEPDDLTEADDSDDEEGDE